MKLKHHGVLIIIFTLIMIWVWTLISTLPPTNCTMSYFSWTKDYYEVCPATTLYIARAILLSWSTTVITWVVLLYIYRDNLLLDYSPGTIGRRVK
jgi:hypothetical protein